MNNIEHTPGPWHRADKGDLGRIFAEGLNQREGIICNVSIGFKDSDIWDANCHLIAAAPDMLAALRSLRNEITGVWGAFAHEIRASISNTNYQVMLDKLDAANSVIAKAEGNIP